MARRMTNEKELRRHPEMKKGSLRPAGEQGKGDAERGSPEARRGKLAKIFGEKCPVCHKNSKADMGYGIYRCLTCNEEFMPL